MCVCIVKFVYTVCTVIHTRLNYIFMLCCRWQIILTENLGTVFSGTLLWEPENETHCFSNITCASLRLIKALSFVYLHTYLTFLYLLRMNALYLLNCIILQISHKCIQMIIHSLSINHLGFIAIFSQCDKLKSNLTIDEWAILWPVMVCFLITEWQIKDTKDLELIPSVESAFW